MHRSFSPPRNRRPRIRAAEREGERLRELYIGEMAGIWPVWYDDPMTKNQVKEVLDRVLTWAPEDQEKVARFVREVEQRRADDDITDEEWEIIEARAARRDLATDKEVEQVFGRYRSA